MLSRFVFTGGFALLAFFAYKAGNQYFQIPEIPKLNENEWWGPGKARQPNFAVTPFQIKVPNPELEYLKERLTSFLERPVTPPLENQGFQYGINSNFLKQVVNYWKTTYDWKRREAYLNQYPQFKTEINGLDIHFLRVKPKEGHKKKVVSLLLLHGWPGSVREFYEIIPLLTTPRSDADFVFEVVVPSLPGYGFSQGASKPGLGPAEMAVIFKNLMSRLKFNKFYVAGGDWGSVIGKAMGQLYPDIVLGFHSTMCVANSPVTNIKLLLGSLYPPLVVENEFKDKMYPLKKHYLGILKEAGYFLLQATKPDTIGTALSDTPAGLAGYILEKFSTWTNRAWNTLPDGGLTQKYTLDALLDNIMIYWITNTITTSQRLYSEYFSPVNTVFNSIPIKVPTACARFENELIWQPESFLKEGFLNLVQVTDIKDGGHFGAFEEPKKFSQDLWSAVKKFQNFHSSTKTSN